MLLFILSIVGILVGVACLIIYDKFCDFDSPFDMIGWFFTMVFGIILVISLYVLLANSICEVGETPRMEQTYDSLMYKAECGEMRDEFGIVNKQYVDEIQEWNESISSGQGFQNSKWTNWFTVIDYESFETINLNDFKY